MSHRTCPSVQFARPARRSPLADHATANALLRDGDARVERVERVRRYLRCAVFDRADRGHAALERDRRRRRGRRRGRARDGGEAARRGRASRPRRRAVDDHDARRRGVGGARRADRRSAAAASSSRGPRSLASGSPSSSRRAAAGGPLAIRRRLAVANAFSASPRLARLRDGAVVLAWRDGRSGSRSRVRVATIDGDRFTSAPRTVGTDVAQVVARRAGSRRGGRLDERVPRASAQNTPLRSARAATAVHDQDARCARPADGSADRHGPRRRSDRSSGGRR